MSECVLILFVAERACVEFDAKSRFCAPGVEPCLEDGRGYVGWKVSLDGCKVLDSCGDVFCGVVGQEALQASV